MMYGIPLVFFYGTLFYGMVGALAVIANPRLLVKRFFMIFDIVPQYTARAGEDVWTIFKEEIRQRFR